MYDPPGPHPQRKLTLPPQQLPVANGSSCLPILPILGFLSGLSLFSSYECSHTCCEFIGQVPCCAWKQFPCVIYHSGSIAFLFLLKGPLSLGRRGVKQLSHSGTISQSLIVSAPLPVVGLCGNHLPLKKKVNLVMV